MNQNFALSYDDILLVPKYSDIESREEVSLSSALDPSRNLDIPLMSAPMDTITEDSMANAIGYLGGLGIIHRYNTIDRQVEIASKAPNSACAIGATGDFLERAEALYGVGCVDFCIDVAHGHHILVKRAIEAMRNRFGNEVYLITGNIATKEAYWDLSDWGSDAIRVSIGSGAVCTTRTNTGHGVPGLQSIINCNQMRSPKQAKIIADGGIRNAGDAVKALALGADFVMVGGMLSGTDECPVKPVQTANGMRVPFRGMASRSSQEDWRGKSSAPEGISTTVPYRGSVVNILKDFVGNLKSGLSYSGARNLKELREKATYVIQSNAGLTESGSHILNRN